MGFESDEEETPRRSHSYCLGLHNIKPSHLTHGDAEVTVSTWLFSLGKPSGLSGL